MITSYLSGLFESHGLPSRIQGDWVTPVGKFPSVRALWYPGESSGRLDVQILLPDKRVILECFAGMGEGESALQDALKNFTINSFHVLMAALWERNDPEQVTTETWSIRGSRYSAFIGNFGTRGSEAVTPHIPEALFPRLEEAIRREPLRETLHWYRFFFANLNQSKIIEALKDNDPWEPGKTCLAEVEWAMKAGYYSARLFMILRAD